MASVNEKGLIHQLNIMHKDGFSVASIKGVKVAGGKITVNVADMSTSQLDSMSGGFARISKVSKRCADIVAELQAKS